MILPISQLKKMSNSFESIDEECLKLDLEAIEATIRAHTNNNFQNRNIRTKGKTHQNKLMAYSPYLRIGDTIEISESINKGLYVIKDIQDDCISLDKDIFDSNHNLITKVEYPADIISGTIKLLEWKYDSNVKKSQNGVASESKSLSRFSTSTTYKNYDSSNMLKGYPIELFDFCNSYCKART